MNNIEAKALALVNGVKTERGRNSYSHYTRLNRALDDGHEALCRAIEQHEAFRREVSDAAQVYEEMCWPMWWEGFERFIIPAPKPDPLVEVLKDLSWDEETAAEEWAADIHAALEARGLEIREKK